MKIIDMYNQTIQGCFKFNYKGYEISISIMNGCNPGLAIYANDGFGDWLCNDSTMTIKEAMEFIDNRLSND